MMQHFGPIMNEGGAAVSLTYIASEKVGYIHTYLPAVPWDRR